METSTVRQLMDQSLGNAPLPYISTRDTNREGGIPKLNRIQYSISIVSNSQLLREGLISLLQRHLNILLVGSFSGHVDTLTQNWKDTWPREDFSNHFVLVDCGLGRENTLHWTRFWRGFDPLAQVIVMELADDAETILMCIEAGAAGYVLEGASSIDVANVICNVHSGQAYCSPEMTALLFARLANRTALVGTTTNLSPLTARELEVLLLVAKGFSNKQISDCLVIETRTVKHHIHNILQKLNTKRRIDAATIAHRAGWLHGLDMRLRQE